MPDISSRAPLPPPRSALGDVVWPSVPNAGTATLYALAQQLADSESLSLNEMQRRQFSQLGRLLDHASKHVPAYRHAIGAAGYRAGTTLTADIWQRLPILRRTHIDAAPTQYVSAFVPPSHGAVSRVATSGTSGKPLFVAKTELEQLMWQAFALRDELWQRWDWSSSLAIIRGDAEGGADGVRLRNWGTPLADLYDTGPAYLLDINLDPATQAAWLLQHRPDYLLTTAGNLRRLIDHAASARERMTLKGVRSISDPVDAALRRDCRDALGAEIVDVYSCAEIGTLALQCPEEGKLHIQSEAARVEILDANGEPCAPGTIGEVIATPLHNFAMPFIRYAVGDRAELGPPCPCGRTLPVIARLHGRTVW